MIHRKKDDDEIEIRIPIRYLIVAVVIVGAALWLVLSHFAR
ncbi:MAG: hypothetical protein MOGMAGMI_02504 [Candidatus Omnitrophica bacterium]|nr:hypothetical protein [Candidatus Omnitrophota bacterium]